jgi:putative transcriptional regulator
MTGQISLKAARVNANRTINQAAQHVGVTMRTIQNYERGKTSPPIHIAIRLARLYGMTIEDIFFPYLLV